MYYWCDICICGLFVIVLRITCIGCVAYLYVDLFVIVFRITCTSGVTYLSVACL